MSDQRVCQPNFAKCTFLTFQRHSGAKKLLYGASEVMNASQFLKQVRLHRWLCSVCRSFVFFSTLYYVIKLRLKLKSSLDCDIDFRSCCWMATDNNPSQAYSPLDDHITQSTDKTDGWVVHRIFEIIFMFISAVVTSWPRGCLTRREVVQLN